MKMKFDVKRYACIMLIGILFNLGFYQIAHTFHLPMWIDNIGTAYAAMILEPAAGLLVAYATNFYQAAFIYDSSSLIYYAVSASCALCIGIGMRKNGRICLKRLFLSLGCYLIISSILSALLTIWRNNGIPDSRWEYYFFDIARNQGIPIYLSCLFGISILKLSDCLVMSILLPLCYHLTPKKYRNEMRSDIVSWKHTTRNQ